MSTDIGFNSKLTDPSNQIALPQTVQKGLSREEHERIVAAACKKLGVKDIIDSDLERITKIARSRIQNVREFAHLHASEVMSKGLDVDRQYLAKEVQTKLLSHFMDYDKETILILYTLFMTQLLCGEVV